MVSCYIVNSTMANSIPSNVVVCFTNSLPISVFAQVVGSSCLLFGLSPVVIQIVNFVQTYRRLRYVANC